MTVFTVEVDVTDRTRTPDGRFATRTRVADVMATDDIDAGLLAAQLVGSCAGPDDMVIATRLVAVAI